MKKILLFLLLITSLYSEEQAYIGLGYGSFNEKFTNNETTESSSNFTSVKAGYGEREKYAIEFSLQYIDNKSKIFSVNDSEKYGFNLDLLKSFDLGIYINPFFKAGFGFGYLTIDREIQDLLHYGVFDCGVGVFIPLSEHLDIELGYIYKYTTYEGIDTIVDKISYSSHTNAAYIGLNTRF